MLERGIEKAAVSLATRTSRRSFIGGLGRGFVALVGGSFVAAALAPERAEAHRLCGHTYTTHPCPHPFHPHTRIDSHGYPVHPKYGYPVDNQGRRYESRSQHRDKTCEVVVPRHYPYVKDPRYGGGWSRCCKGRVRHISDCCSYSQTRINGDAAVTGYCYGGRKVFCVQYYDTQVPC